MRLWECCRECVHGSEPCGDEDCKEPFHEAVKSLAKAEARIKDLLAERDEVKSINMQLAADILVLWDEKEKALARIKELEDKLKEYRRLWNNLDAQDQDIISSHADTIVTQEGRITELEVMVDDTMNKANALADGYADEKRELEDLLEEKVKALARRNETVASLEEKNAQLKTDLAEMTESNDNWVTKCDELTEEIEPVKKENIKLKAGLPCQVSHGPEKCEECNYDHPDLCPFPHLRDEGADND